MPDARRHLATFFAIAWIWAPPAAAQQTLGDTAPEPATQEARTDEFSGFVGLGGGVLPRYEGADRYQFSPFAIATVEWKGMELQVRGLRARLNLVDNGSMLIGPAIGTRGNRNADDTPFELDGLDRIGRPIEIGGFVGYRLGGDENGRGEVGFDVTVLKDVNHAHDGFTVSSQISYAAIRSGRLFADFDVQSTFGDRRYMRTYFGVTSAESARTGLPTYRVGSGVRDIGLGVTAGYQLSEHWGLIARAGASQYVGDAKDSPIVDRGASTQFVGGLGLTFRF
jgi:MipA family protein